jgi:hypothetical protein
MKKEEGLDLKLIKNTLEARGYEVETYGRSRNVTIEGYPTLYIDHNGLLIPCDEGDEESLLRLILEGLDGVTEDIEDD